MPFDPVLTLETAALMLVAFVIGATIGSLLHLGLRKLRPAPVVSAEAPAISEVAAEVALVAAPVIAPLAVPREQVVPTEIPVPDFAAGMALAPPPLELAPARKPGTATFGRDVGRHDRMPPPVEPEARLAPPSEEDPPRIEPEFFATTEPPTSDAPSLVGEAEPPADLPAYAVPLNESDAAETPVTLPAIDVTAEILALAPAEALPLVEVVLVDPDISTIDADEAAAMRAIEGNWTPGRRAQPAEPPAERIAAASPELVVPVPAPLPEPLEPEATAAVFDELKASDIVVTKDDEAETLTVEAVPLAEAPDVLPQHEEDRIIPAEPSDEPEPEPELEAPELPAAAIFTPAPTAQDQPPGLGAPRHGMRDDLTQIVGVLPVVETTLNRIGVYHFDQVADWSDAHAGWVEAHLAIAGRIEREQWREQARELAAIASGKRPSRKKRPS